MNNMEQQFEEVYGSLAELWCSPQDVDMNKVRSEGEKAVRTLKVLDDQSAILLDSFLKEPSITEEEYVSLFELTPRCSLYLGSHVYEEPKTCAQAGVSDRNGYMIDLGGIFKHFGWTPDGKELPDYLPSLMEFLGLTVQSRNDPVRKKLIKEYILPFLPPLTSRLEELKTPYLFLLKACERIINFEEVHHVG